MVVAASAGKEDQWHHHPCQGHPAPSRWLRCHVETRSSPKKTHLFTRLFEPLDFFFSPASFYCNGSLILWTVFILARLQMCSGGLFLYWPVSRFEKSRKDGYARRLGAGGGRGASARSWLMVGELLSTLVCADKSKSNREAAKACMAAWLSIALQREIKALVMERWRMAGACLALDCAKSPNEGGCFLAPPGRRLQCPRRPVSSAVMGPILGKFFLCCGVLRAGLPLQRPQPGGEVARPGLKVTPRLCLWLTAHRPTDPTHLR